MTATTALLGVLMIAAAGYTSAVRRVRAAGGRWRTGRVVAWWAGTLLAGLALAPTTQAWAHHDLRGHMTVHLLLGMYAGIAFALAAPVTLALAAAPPALRRTGTRVASSRPVGVIAHPVTAAVLDIGGLWLLYTTPLLSLAGRDGTVQAVLHLHLLLGGALFAWAIAGPEQGRRKVGLRIGVLVAAGAAHAVLAKRLALDVGWAGWHGGPVDAAQADAAAQLMYYGGDVAEVILAFLVMRMVWHRPQRRVATPAPLPAAS